MPQIINNIEYYKITEIADISGVNARTLRRWIANGELDHFLYKYQEDANSPVLCRLEPPTEDDVLWENNSNVYHLPRKGVV